MICLIYPLQKSFILLPFLQDLHFFSSVPEIKYRVITNDVSDYINLFVKEVTAIQKLNSHHCKEQLKKFFSSPLQLQYVLHLLPCTHQDDIRLRDEHFAIKADQFLQSLFVFESSSCSGL
jgi:hypothetical protein